MLYPNDTTHRHRQILSPGVLPHIFWHITDKCYMQCPYCCAPKNNQEFNVDRIDDNITLFKELKVQKIDLSGGEPLLHPKLDYIAGKLHSHRIALSITTGSIGLQRNKDWLVSNAGIFNRIIFSIDGFDKKGHDHQRKYPGAFDSAVSLIKSLDNDKLRVNTVVTPSFLSEGVERMIDFIQTLPIKEWCLIQPCRLNAKVTFDEILVERRKFENVIKYVEHEMKKKSGIELLYRYPESYTGYWILYPGNKLLRYDEINPDKNTLLDFKYSNLSVIKNRIINNDKR